MHPAVSLFFAYLKSLRLFFSSKLFIIIQSIIHTCKLVYILQQQRFVVIMYAGRSMSNSSSRVYCGNQIS